MPAPDPDRPTSPTPAPPRRDGDDRPVLPDRSRDDEDRGWGDEGEARRDAEWYRRQRPPHHGD